MERKVERRLDWAEGREKKAAASNKASRGLINGIPFGQPILIGHHSEKRHRRTLERSQGHMRKSVEHSDMADHHRSKAAGIQSQLDNSIFSDDADAIEQLKARIEGREKERELNNTINKIVRKKPKNEKTPGKIEALAKLGIKEAIAVKLFEPDCCGRIGIPSYVNQNLSGNINRDKKRLAELERRAVTVAKAENTESGILIEKPGNGYAFITFSEKPDYDTRAELKAAGFRWNKTSWVGDENNIPECITN